MKTWFKNHCLTIFIVSVIVIAVLMWGWDYESASRVASEAKPYTGAHAKDAIENMQHWATWLAALQSGALAAFGSVLIHRREKNLSLTDTQYISASGAVIFLSASILTATYVLGCLPSVALRLKDWTSKDNDIYELSIFGFIDKAQIRVGLLTSLEHCYALIGMVSMGVFVFSFFLGDSRNEPTPAAEAASSE